MTKTTATTRRFFLGQASGGGLALVSGSAWADSKGPSTTVDLPLPGGPQARAITTAFPQKAAMILQRTRPPLLETPFDVLRNGKDRFAQYVPPRAYPQTYATRSGKAAILSLGRSFGDAYGDVAVEVRRREQVSRRCAVRQMGNGGSGDVTSPRVLDGQGNTERNT